MIIVCSYNIVIDPPRLGSLPNTSLSRYSMHEGSDFKLKALGCGDMLGLGRKPVIFLMWMCLIIVYYGDMIGIYWVNIYIYIYITQYYMYIHMVGDNPNNQ